MKLIKLTDNKGRTQRGMKWPVGKTNSIDPKLRKPKLCTDGVLHAYTSIPLALLMASYHGCAHYTRVLEIEANVEVSDPMKCGTYEATVLRELPLPDWYTDKNKRIKAQAAFAIACAEAVLPIFEAQCPDDDRPRKAIEAAKNGSANAASGDAADAAADAAVAATTWAARDAAYATAIALQKYASWTTTSAANRAATRAAAGAVDANPNINLDKLAVDAVNSL